MRSTFIYRDIPLPNSTSLCVLKQHTWFGFSAFDPSVIRIILHIFYNTFLTQHVLRFSMVDTWNYLFVSLLSGIPLYGLEFPLQNLGDIAMAAQ